MWTGRDFVSALEGVERAVSLNPSAPLARHFLACVLEFSGRPAEALPHIDAILRLDPRYRLRSLAIRRPEPLPSAARDPRPGDRLRRTAVRTQPSNVRARQRLVAALSLAGLADRAKTAAAELQPPASRPSISPTSTTPTPSCCLKNVTGFVGSLRASRLWRVRGASSPGAQTPLAVPVASRGRLRRAPYFR